MITPLFMVWLQLVQPLLTTPPSYDTVPLPQLLQPLETTGLPPQLLQPLLTTSPQPLLHPLETTSPHPLLQTARNYFAATAAASA